MTKATVYVDPRTTPAVRVSYPAVFEKRSMNGGVPAYSVTLMFDKKDADHMAFLKLLMADMTKVLEGNWPDVATRPRIPLHGHDKSPVKDGDTAINQQGIPLKEKNPEYAGHFIIRATSYNDTMTVVDKNKADILDRSQLYGGCVCKANINPYARMRSDNQGISVGLNGIQKWADGESFGSGAGRPNVDSMFESSGANDPTNYGGNSDAFFGATGTDDPFAN